ncbi:bifunctional riboflavin kinase/FAD synthetase [Planctomicrobium sp. SH661]|uniref:bifunctional riboflavin kinase/FAD synthetase n=1 Tax=Planctomicrobium sp. SH661 TaxID=3448124 RepID=UPI003F5B65C2
MNRLRGLENLNHWEECVLSIGNFDGVHLGHQAILSALIDHAQRLSVPAVVMTFEPHPAALLNPDRQPPRLTTPQQKAELIGSLGVDTVVEYPTDWNLLALSPREFFDEIVLKKLRAAGLVEGPNFYFGKGRTGNGEVLREFCGETGKFLEIVAPTTLQGEIVSSSFVRQAISQGDVRRAAALLGRNYTFRGKVVNGARRGRSIGFPTANLEQIETMLCADGVYAARARVQNQTYQAAVSIGPNPTFAEGTRKVEAHLLDVTADFYGQEMELELVDRVRGLQKFDSLESLQHQIESDVTSIRNLLNQSR